MGRKQILKTFLETKSMPPQDPPEGEPPAPQPPRSTGAVGAVSRSIADLKSRSVAELDPALIDGGGVRDRIEADAEDEDALVASIRDHGQQVPVLVRPHPEEAGRYQIVYGRRRLSALRDLGLPVKALIRDLDDKALVIAQGQENTARKDLTFIEKANFARQMRDAGYDRKAICDALTVDKTVVSRMLMIADCVPIALIEEIGSAPGVGRDRWQALALALEPGDIPAEEALQVAVETSDQGADACFKAVLEFVAGPEAAPRKAAPRAKAAKAARSTPLTGADGQPLGSWRETASGLSVSLSAAQGQGFEDWLVQNIGALHREWLAGRKR